MHDFSFFFLGLNKSLHQNLEKTWRVNLSYLDRIFKHEDSGKLSSLCPNDSAKLISHDGGPIIQTNHSSQFDAVASL